MNAENKPINVEVTPIVCVVPKSQGKEEPELKNDSLKPILPLALQDAEISDSDVEVMLNITRDKKAEAGRYKRIPKHLPTAHTPIVQK